MNLTPHFLSFDVEEYFHVEAAAGIVRRDDWPYLEKRLAAPLELILELLDTHKTRATFFVLGWIAEHSPHLVRRIADAGHEIAAHSQTHRMITALTPDEFRTEITDVKRNLEDLTGRRVLGFRAPTFSVTRRTLWALDLLAETGYCYDSSIFPVRHDRYGIHDAPRFIHHAAGPAGKTLVEIPPLTLRAFGCNWPVAGGGYLRLLPVRFVAAGLRQFEKYRQPGMIYLHPWEFDPDQPVLPMPGLARWRHRVGLSSTAKKLCFLLRRFRFTCAADYFAAECESISQPTAIPASPPAEPISPSVTLL